MIYLASPYSNPDLAKMQLRYEVVRDLTAKLLKREIWVYSPIVHCHDLAEHNEMPKSSEFWYNYNVHMMSLAEQLWVLYMEGTEESKGIAGEIAWWEANRSKDTLSFIVADAW
jgi:hypothetical protein